MAIIGQDIQRARVLLEKGELVGVPTETVYGLAANALDAAAVAKIFLVKNRPYFDPLIVHVPSLDAARRYVVDVPPSAEVLASHFWPGPLTLLLAKRNIIPDLVTAGLDRVGVRSPDHPLTIELLRQIPFPLAAPSANPFGYVSPTSAHHVQDQLGAQIPYILDGGPCSVGVESTIIGWEDGAPVIHRQGGVTQEQIESVIGRVTIRTQPALRPDAPGQLASHYAPKKKLLLGNITELADANRQKRLGVLAFRAGIDSVAMDFQRILSVTGDLNEAARNLFGMLRQLDRMDIDAVLAEEVPDVGLGRAINDRLRRAAADGPSNED